MVNTFREEGALCIYMGGLNETGFVCTLGGFGFTQVAYENILPNLPIKHKFPITDAIRLQDIVKVSNDEAYLAKYPLMKVVNFSQPWNTLIALPCNPMNGFAITFSAKLEVTELLKVFLYSIASLLGLYTSRLRNTLLEIAQEANDEIEQPFNRLSDRQLVIAQMLEQGFSNAHIGLKLGYSESLIRQETVTIYRKLQVSGKKAMQVKNASKLEQEALESNPLNNIA